MNGTAIVRGSTASGSSTRHSMCTAGRVAAKLHRRHRLRGRDRGVQGDWRIRRAGSLHRNFTGGSGAALGYAVDAAILTGCTATGWPNGGFFANNSTLSGCNASSNGGVNVGNGIACDSNCLVVGNTARQNGYNGIGAGGSNNRIDGNTVINNVFSGIEVANGNVVVRNISRGNGTNYTPASGPDIGPTNQTPSGASSPWANF